MSTVPSQISKYMGNAVRLADIWGNIIVNVKDTPYRAEGDGVTDDTAAITAAISAVNTAGGGIVFFPKGIYLVSNLDISGIDNITFEGVGVDATILRMTSATGDLFTSTTASRWRTFKDFTIDNSVDKTAGAYFNFTGAEYRTCFQNLKLKGWFNGIVLEIFEQIWIDKLQIAEPDGAGTALAIGKSAASVQGANVMIRDCFIRGTNGTDGVGGSEVGNYGVYIYDADAVFMENTDMGGFLESDLVIKPTARAGNHYFSQCFFDATTNGPSVSMEGTGTKQEITFTGCWIGGAGQNSGGSDDVPGLWIKNEGTYRTLQFTGCRFHTNKGSGVKFQPIGADATFTGCLFNFNGEGGVSGDNYGFHLDSGLNAASAHIVGCSFGGNDGDDIYVEANSRLYTIQDCYMEGTFTNNGIAKRISGITTANSSTVASATTITIPAGLDFVNISGTVNIGGVTPTFAGHIITLKFLGILTVIDDALGLRLASNFTTSAGDILTLVCDGAEWYEVSRSVN